MGRLADLVTPQNTSREIGVFGVDLTPRRSAACCPMCPETRASSDVIYAINGKPVDSVERLKTMLAALPANAPFVLQVEREGTLLYLSFPVER